MRDKATVKKWFWDVVGAYCRHCGYNRSIAALQAHHLSEGQKKGKGDTLAAVIQRGFAYLAEWASRTDFIILCANCHAELHAGLWSAEHMKPDNARLGSMAFLPAKEQDAMMTDLFLDELPTGVCRAIECHRGKFLTMKEKQMLAAFYPVILSQIPISI